MRHEILQTFFLAIEPFFPSFMFDQEQGKQAITRILFERIIELGNIRHCQKIAKRTVTATKGSQSLFNADNQIEQALELVAGDLTDDPQAQPCSKAQPNLSRSVLPAFRSSVCRYRRSFLPLAII